MENTSLDPKTLKANPWNTNRVGPENMRKLKQSITDLGFASTVVCRTLEDGSLQILGGHHRVEAAVELGIKSVPVLNLGTVDDARAKKISLVDNSRYGTDDTISLAKIYEELGLTSEDLAAFMPYSQADFDTVKRAIDIDLDALDIDIGDDDQPVDPEDIKERPSRTHDTLKFRVSLGNAEKIRQMVEKAIKKHGFDEATDDLTAAGEALAHLLLASDAE